MQRVIARDDEAGKVSEQLATEIKYDEEEVERPKTDGSVRLGHTGLLLEVVQGGVLGELEGQVVSTTPARERGAKVKLAITSLSIAPR